MLAPARPRIGASCIRQRRLVRGAEQVLGVDLGAVGVEDRRLDRTSEELLGVAAEELVKRVLAGDVDRQPAPAASGPAPHLPQTGDRPGKVTHTAASSSPMSMPSSSASVATTPSSSPLVSRRSISWRCAGV